MTDTAPKLIKLEFFCTLSQETLTEKIFPLHILERYPEKTKVKKSFVKHTTLIDHPTEIKEYAIYIIHPSVFPFKI